MIYQAHPIGCACLWATLATLLLIGQVSSNIKKDFHKFWVFNQQALLPWCWDTRLINQKRLQLPSASDGPRVVSRLWMPRMNPMGRSLLSLMKKYYLLRRY